MATPPETSKSLPLPSDEGLGIMEAWEAAWHATEHLGERELNLLYGYEGLAGFDVHGLAGNRSTLHVVPEALDGRIQQAGLWQFVFKANESLHGVVVSLDGVEVFDGRLVGLQSVNPLRGAPQHEPAPAVLDCRRQGADDYLSETGQNFIQYLARPMQGRESEPNWMLVIAFGTMAQIPGEVEAAGCRLDQESGDVTYIPAEQSSRTYDPV